ncbi:MAG: YcjX family protein [Rubrimonas sp.]|uniref:YcjX family protein n=1 Tax=Rubrimonas sp. TaxID=2036015 RepID=UPI002FDD5286
MLGRLIDDLLLRPVEEARDAASEAFLEPTLRLGVTGLSRAGKTVFITSLVANLLARGRMQRLRAQADGRIAAVALRPQPDRGVPRFEFERHMADLAGEPPRWPASTRSVSQLRLSVRYRSESWLAGLAGAFSGPQTLHLDIVDYPGEWLLDLPLMGMRYAEWSAKALAAAETPLRAGFAERWRAALAEADPTAPYDEARAQALAEGWRVHLAACKDAGLSGLTPGRFLAPGDLEGSPALTFAPLPDGPGDRRSLRAEFARRYDAYRAQVIAPFFRDHFARIERQIVLVDLLSALDAGPGAVGDLRAAMGEILGCFRPGANSWLSALLGRRVDRILFAATKADHVHHSQHPRMTAILQALLRESVERAQFRGAQVEALAVAGLRATVEQEIARDGETLACVRGKLKATGREAALYPGEIPDDPQAVLASAREGLAHEPGWLGGAFDVMDFAPPKGAGGASAAPGRRDADGPPHIRLDRALDFLIGDRLA